MQIAVTYQKTKSILSACSDAVGGSQFGYSATTVTAPPMSRASSVNWTIAPLRIFRARAYRLPMPRCSPEHA